MYTSTRAEEVAATGWPQDQIDAFLEMQFEAQRRHYRGTYTDTEYDVILVDGEPAGRLYVARWPDQIHIVDIALLPEFRSRGIGTDLIAALFEESDASGLPVSIFVEVNNPARTLYDRLGFTPVGESGIYLELERRPTGAAATPS